MIVSLYFMKLKDHSADYFQIKNVRKHNIWWIESKLKIYQNSFNFKNNFSAGLKANIFIIYTQFWDKAIVKKKFFHNCDVKKLTVIIMKFFTEIFLMIFQISSVSCFFSFPKPFVLWAREVLQQSPINGDSTETVLSPDQKQVFWKINLIKF